MPKGDAKMRDFINECFDHYSFILVSLFWIPVMFICLPVALIAVCMKLAFKAVSEMFVEDGNE